MKKSESDEINRRKFLKIGGGFLLICAGAGLGPVLLRNRKLYSMTRNIMGTIGEIQVVHDDARTAYRVIETAFEELARLEQKLTFFSDESEIGRINLRSFSEEVSVSIETAQLITRALHWSNVTNGFFEPGLGKVTAIWDIKHRTEPPPTNQWIRLANRSFHEKIILSDLNTAPKVRFRTDDIKIDLGGIAKGYSADRAIAVLAAQGIDQALVRLGGDISTLGGKSDNQAWRVGVKNPNALSEILKVISLRNQTVATSGNYEQYFLSHGQIYHHLLDPTLGKPPSGNFRSVTVIGDNCRDTDALATGLFFLSHNERRRILDDNTDHFDFISCGT